MSAVLGDSLSRGLVKTRVREIDEHFEKVRLQYLDSSNRNTNFRRGIENIRSSYRPFFERLKGDRKQKVWFCLAFDIDPDGRIRLLEITIPFKSPHDLRCLTFKLTINPHCVQRLFQTFGSTYLSVNTIGLLMEPHFDAMAKVFAKQQLQNQSVKTFRVKGEMVIWRAYGSGYEAITVIDCDKLDGVNLRDYERLLAGYQVDNAYLIGGEHGCNP